MLKITIERVHKDVLNEIEGNLRDAIGIARNIMQKPKLVHGGSALLMDLAYRLNERSFA